MEWKVKVRIDRVFTVEADNEDEAMMKVNDLVHDDDWLWMDAERSYPENPVDERWGRC